MVKDEKLYLKNKNENINAGRGGSVVYYCYLAAYRRSGVLVDQVSLKNLR